MHAVDVGFERPGEPGWAPGGVEEWGEREISSAVAEAAAELGHG